MRIEPTNLSELQDFRPNSYFENMLRLKRDEPKTYAILSPSEKIALQIYLEQKTKHEQEKIKC